MDCPSPSPSVAGPTPEPGQHQMLRGWVSNPRAPAQGTPPSHVRASGDPGHPGQRRGCVLSGQRRYSGGLFPGCDTDVACSLEGSDIASIVCPEVSGARHRSRRHPTCHLSCSPQLGDASHPSCPNRPGRASWTCRAGLRRRNSETGAEGTVLLHTCQEGDQWLTTSWAQEGLN